MDEKAKKNIHSTQTNMSEIFTNQYTSSDLNRLAANVKALTDFDNVLKNALHQAKGNTAAFGQLPGSIDGNNWNLITLEIKVVLLLWSITFKNV